MPKNKKEIIEEELEVKEEPKKEPKLLRFKQVPQCENCTGEVVGEYDDKKYRCMKCGKERKLSEMVRVA